MSEHRQAARARSEDTREPEAEAADLRDEKLDEAVECCLAEIDAVLDEAKSEEDKARAEYDEIVARFRGRNRDAVGRYNTAESYEVAAAAWRDAEKAELDAEDELRVLQAKYAHLGIDIGICCGEPYFLPVEES